MAQTHSVGPNMAKEEEQEEEEEDTSKIDSRITFPRKLDGR